MRARERETDREAGETDNAGRDGVFQLLVLRTGNIFLETHRRLKYQVFPPRCHLWKYSLR